MIDKLKTQFAKKRHGELMVATAGAMLLAVADGLLDPETLKFLDSAVPPAGWWARVVIWIVVIVLAMFLLKRGLVVIDRERNQESEAKETESTLPVTLPHTPKAVDVGGVLNIKINHGHTQIVITINQEQELNK